MQRDDGGPTYAMLTSDELGSNNSSRRSSTNSDSFFMEEVASAWDSRGDGYYSHQETEELADLVSRERREQFDIERTTEHVRKWIK